MLIVLINKGMKIIIMIVNIRVILMVKVNLFFFVW